MSDESHMKWEREGQLRLGVYGAERFGLELSNKELDSPNFAIEFIPYETDRRLSEFDGIVTFQRLFEQFEMQRNFYRGSHLRQAWHRDELDKRQKEVVQLLHNGGFIVFLLHKPLIDSYAGVGYASQYRDTDLVKRFLNQSGLYRTDLKQRSTGVRCVRDEFREFFDKYGAAWTTYSNHTGRRWRHLAMLGDAPVSMIIVDCMFFISSLLPDQSKVRLREFHSLLCDAVVGCVKKMRVALPSWVEELMLPNEAEIQEEHVRLVARMKELERKRVPHTKFKRILIGDGDALVDDVVYAISEGLGIPTTADDNLREDVQIIGATGEIAALVEVKGTSRGVKREHVNQADSHRERAGKPDGFPSLLIINTNTKNARSMAEKDVEVAPEQVAHAAKMRVLILRTLDVLNLIVLMQKGTITTTGVLGLFQNEVGWLKANSDTFEVISS